MPTDLFVARIGLDHRAMRISTKLIDGDSVLSEEADAPDPSSRIVVVFRNDDLSACSDPEHEARVTDIAERYAVPQTLGVIPRCTADDPRNPHGSRERLLSDHSAMIDFLRDYARRSGSEIALHGLTHRTNRRSMPSRREYSEFSDLPADEQEQMLREGLAILEAALGIRPRTFIPPWNCFDDNTLRACCRADLPIFSAGPYAPASFRVVSLGTDCDLHSFEELLHAAQGSETRVLLRVLYHSRTLRSRDELSALERAMRLASTTPGVRVLTVAQAVHEYRPDVDRANAAARNVVPQTELRHTARARVMPYRRSAYQWTRGTALERVYEQAERAYAAGDYDRSHVLSTSIDARCRRWLACCRLLIGGAAGAAGLLWGLIVTHFTAGERLAFYFSILGTMSTTGLILRWKATAPDTRREIAVATFLGTLSTAIGMLIRESLQVA